jgi:hypothetical protein
MPSTFAENAGEEKRIDRANARNRLNNWLKLAAATIGLPRHPERRNLIGREGADETGRRRFAAGCANDRAGGIQLLYANNQDKPKVTASCEGTGFRPSWFRSDGPVPFSFANVGIAGNPAWSA